MTLDFRTWAAIHDQRFQQPNPYVDEIIRKNRGDGLPVTAFMRALFEWRTENKSITVHYPENRDLVSHDNRTVDNIQVPEKVEPPTPPSAFTLPNLETRAGSRFLHYETWPYSSPDETKVDLREVTGFSALYFAINDDWATIDRFLSVCSSQMGANSIRVLGQLGSPIGGFWDGFHFHPKIDGDKYFGTLVKFARFCASRGFYVHFGLFGELSYFDDVDHNLLQQRRDAVSGNSVLQASMMEYAIQTVGTLRQETNVFWQVANEPNQIGFGEDNPFVLELGDMVKQLVPNRICDAGAQGEGNTYFDQDPFDFHSFHLLRQGVRDYNRSIIRMVRHTDIDGLGVVSSDEPFNMGNLGPSTDGTKSIATAFGLGAMGRVKELAINTFHWNGGLFMDAEHPETHASMQAFAKGLNSLRMGMPSGDNNGDAVDRWTLPPTEEDYPTWDGPLRVFIRGNRDRYLGISIGEPHGYQPSWNWPPDSEVIVSDGVFQNRVIARGMPRLG